MGSREATKEAEYHALDRDEHVSQTERRKLERLARAEALSGRGYSRATRRRHAGSGEGTS